MTKFLREACKEKIDFIKKKEEENGSLLKTPIPSYSLVLIESGEVMCLEESLVESTMLWCFLTSMEMQLCNQL